MLTNERRAEFVWTNLIEVLEGGGGEEEKSGPLPMDYIVGAVGKINIWKRLFTDTVTVNKMHLTNTVPVNKMHFTDTVSVNKVHLTGTL